MNDFGTLLYTLRKEKGWTQTELADKLGMTNQAVSKWETGDSYPETLQLLKLSELFGITVDDLLKGKKSDSITEPSAVSAPSEPKNVKPKSWSKTFALLMSAGMFLLFSGVILCVITSVVFEDNAKLSLAGVIAMLILIALGVAFFIVGVIYDKFYFLDVPNGNHKTKVARFSFSIASGVTLCIFAAAAFTSIAFFTEKSAGTIAFLVIGFLLITTAVILFIFSGMTWTAYTEELKTANLKLPEEHEHPKGLSRFAGVIMMSCTAIYLVLGFVFKLWHPGWVVFPVGGILCGILGAIDKAENEKK